LLSGSSRPNTSHSDPVRPPRATQGATRAEHGDPDLDLIVREWATLPEAVRVGIIAMVRAADRRPGRRQKKSRQPSSEGRP